MTTRSLPLRATVLALALLFASACSDSDEQAQSADTAADDESSGGTDGNTPPAADGGAVDGSGAVDACARFSPDDFESVMGVAPGEPESSGPTGSLLGQCSYTTEDFKGTVDISLRRADEYDASVETYDTTPVDVPGAAAAAIDPDVGLFVQVDGEEWFLHIIAVPDALTDMSTDEAAAVAVAELFLS